MIPSEKLIPPRDELVALIAAAKAPVIVPVPPPIVISRTIPAWAIAEGCASIEFFDGFDDPSTINLKIYPLSEDPGKFNWYLNWSAQANDFFTVDNSYLTIDQDRSNGGGATLVTVPYGYPDQGHSFRGSRCFECRTRWDSSQSPDHFPNAGSVFWSFSINHMRWQMENRRTGRDIPPLHIAELDLLESPKENTQKLLMSIADWHYSGQDSNPKVEAYWATFLMMSDPAKAWADYYGVIALIPGFDYREWHTYGTSYKSALENGGTGYVKRFIDGIHLPWMDVFWKPGELFSALDDDARQLIIGTGLTTEAQYDHVAVYR